jgi:hypothetical protein
MSDGKAAPVIQYGNVASADPGGKFPTGNKSQPAKHVIATARHGSVQRNKRAAASAKAANMISIIMCQIKKRTTKGTPK